jgi:hypothetical protein
MAILSITAANVVPVNGNTRTGTAGVAITAGQVVYLDPTDGKYRLASANSGTAAARVPAGIALHSAAAGQPLVVQSDGQVTIGAALTAGVAYYLAATAGGISPVADLTTGWYPTIIGIAVSTTVLDIKIHASGVAL